MSNTKCCTQNCNQGRHCPLRKIASAYGPHAQADEASIQHRLNLAYQAQEQRTLAEQVAYWRGRAERLEETLRGRQNHIGGLERRVAELEAHHMTTADEKNVKGDDLIVKLSEEATRLRARYINMGYRNTYGRTFEQQIRDTEEYQSARVAAESAEAQLRAAIHLKKAGAQ